MRRGRPKRQLWLPGMWRSPACDVVALSVRRREGVAQSVRRVTSLPTSAPACGSGGAHAFVGFWRAVAEITLLADMPVRPLSRNPVVGHYSR